MQPPAYVELFHLLFLRQFHTQIDPKLYAIKGGCNLRFFFESIRYSEDLDIDIQTIQKSTLQQKVQKILTSPGLLKTLQAYGITQIESSAPKQTETTQRWKIKLHTQSISLPLSTKIEFSRRQESFNASLASVPMSLAQAYHLPPTRLSHYEAQEALNQKVKALAYRALTQARDVFDIYHLLHKVVPTPQIYPSAEITAAQMALTSLRYQDYQSQVVSFLPLEEQLHFDDLNYWNSMTNAVLAYLQTSSAS